MNYIELAKQVGLDWQTGWTLEDGEPNRLETLCKLAAEHEREECAKLCDDMDSTSDYYGPRVELICAEAIRARGEA
jgi:hypothetical protein